MPLKCMWYQLHEIINTMNIQTVTASQSIQLSSQCPSRASNRHLRKTITKDKGDNQENNNAFSLYLPRFNLICSLETFWVRAHVSVFDSFCVVFYSCICQNQFVGCTAFCSMSCANTTCKIPRALLCLEPITWTFNWIPPSFVFWKAVNNHSSLTFPNLLVISHPVPLFDTWVLVIFVTPQK